MQCLAIPCTLQYLFWKPLLNTHAHINIPRPPPVRQKVFPTETGVENVIQAPLLATVSDDLSKMVLQILPLQSRRKKEIACWKILTLRVKVLYFVVKSTFCPIKPDTSILNTVRKGYGITTGNISEKPQTETDVQNVCMMYRDTSCIIISPPLGSLAEWLCCLF